MKLKSRQVMAQPRSYRIAERLGGVRFKLSGACASTVPLGKIVNIDPDLSLMAGEEKDKKHDLMLSKKRELLKEEIVEVHGYKDFDAANIWLTNGTYEANFLALSEAIDDGDEVVVIRPCWYQFAAYSLEDKKYVF